MSARDWIKDHPLSAVTTSFLAGFSLGSGLGQRTVVAAQLLARSEQGRRVVAVAYPLARKAITEALKAGVVDAVKGRRGKADAG